MTVETQPSNTSIRLKFEKPVGIEIIHGILRQAADATGSTYSLTDKTTSSYRPSVGYELWPHEYGGTVSRNPPERMINFDLSIVLPDDSHDTRVYFNGIDLFHPFGWMGGRPNCEELKILTDYLSEVKAALIQSSIIKVEEISDAVPTELVKQF